MGTLKIEINVYNLETSVCIFLVLTISCPVNTASFIKCLLKKVLLLISLDKICQNYVQEIGIIREIQF